MQRDSPKPARVTRPSLRLGRSRLADARNSERKNPNGTKTAMFESVSTGPCPLFRNMREKSSVRSCPAACFMIPKYRIPTAVSSRNRPIKTVSPKATAPYTEHFFRIRRMTRNLPHVIPGLTGNLPLSFRPSASERRNLSYQPSHPHIHPKPNRTPNHIMEHIIKLRKTPLESKLKHLYQE